MESLPYPEDNSTWKLLFPVSGSGNRPAMGSFSMQSMQKSSRVPRGPPDSSRSKNLPCVDLNTLLEEEADTRDAISNLHYIDSTFIITQYYDEVVLTSLVLLVLFLVLLRGACESLHMCNTELHDYTSFILNYVHYIYLQQHSTTTAITTTQQQLFP